MLIPKIIDGGFALDDRGQVTFFNNFDLKKLERFYIVENFSTDTIRAFHAHLLESKYILVVSGTALVCAVHVDRPDAPNKENKVHRFVLSEKQPSILFIPKEYANGIKALEPNTRILFFSDTSLEKSKNDDYRIPYDYWGKNIWVVDNR